MKINIKNKYQKQGIELPENIQFQYDNTSFCFSSVANRLRNTSFDRCEVINNLSNPLRKIYQSLDRNVEALFL